MNNLLARFAYSLKNLNMQHKFQLSVFIFLTVVLTGRAPFTLTAAPAKTETITQFGITWTFEEPVEFGQFANGDYWVVGPVKVVHLDPPSTEVDGRVKNGSMINPSPQDGSTQGYDSSMYGTYGPHFDPVLNVARPNNQSLSAGNPLNIPVSSSLVSTISRDDAGVRPQLETAAILTVLDAPAEDGSFRPPYSGSDKSIRHQTDQINWSLLKNLDPVGNMPDLSAVERNFERPWLDHVPNWLGRELHPTDNMPDYGREISTKIGVGALMLHLDFPQNEKETLLIRYLQLGIDFYGIVEDGGTANWAPNGGHASGRKWPILFAGLMLDDEGMQNIGSGDGSGAALFGEDAQTFYVTQEDIDSTHNPDTRGCELEEYEQSDLGMAEWGIRHSTEPVKDNKAWCANYRTCCTANAWAGFVLAAHIMDAKELWDHDPLFDYQDRYMGIQEPGDWTRCQDPFTEQMWDRYRAGPIEELDQSNYLPFIHQNE
ncbi:MAG: hypothetical protein AB8G95_09950 [Anaerolineae bacterium]